MWEMPITLPVPILHVQQISKDIWLKRDDVHVPFTDTPMNGAKTYQCLNLIRSHLNVIRDRYEGTVFSDNFLESPQAPIVARVTQEFGLRCIIPIATSSIEAAMRHRSMQLVRGWGGEIDILCRMGFALKHRAPQKYGNRYFRVKFGMSADSTSVLSSVVEPVRRQAEAFIGLPTEDMTLVVPVGSGVVMGSLLVGMADRGIKFKRIVGVQISGYDRMDTIERIILTSGYTLPQGGLWEALQPNARTVQDFDFVIDKTYPYAHHLSRDVGGITLDSQYEAKAWDWVLREKVPGPLVFYVVGNANCLR